MQKPIFSYIIPVYNAEKTIIKTVESIINQPQSDFSIEIIICNDGSTDNSLALLKELQKKHKEIILFDRENQGVYKTRNFCLDQVTGDYVWLIDSDDIIVDDAFKYINNHLLNNEIDVLNFGYFAEDNNYKTKKRIPPKVNELMDGISFLASNDGRLYLWNNIYNVNFLRTENIKFLAKSVSLEDSLFNIEVFSKAKKVFCLQEILYVYCFNNNSISRTKNLNHLINLGTSSCNVHLSTKAIRNQFSKNSSSYNTINTILMQSTLGFFYSLLVEKYPMDYIKKIVVIYSENELLPVKMKNIPLKLKIFQTMVNNKYPYMILCWMNNLIR